MSGLYHSKKKAIRQLRHAKEELREAIAFIRKNKLERAEDEIADAIKYAARAIRKISRLESLSNNGVKKAGRLTR